LARIRVISLSFFALFAAAAVPTVAAEPFSIQDAIRQAVRTHPGVGEAAANRRATDAELRQQQSTLLPQVRLEARTGKTRFGQKDPSVPIAGADQWSASTSQSVFVRQLLFDGFTSINEIWRQAARVDAAAARVFERTELVALDAVEAYVDVVRYQKIVADSQANVEAHRKIAANVRARFQGGRAGEGDLEQVLERVAQADASLARYRQSLEDARAAYRQTVGIEPFNLRQPYRLTRIPKSRDTALAIALKNNPTIKAAKADADAARYAFRSTDGTLSPTISLEGRAEKDYNSSVTLPGRTTNESGFLVFSWDVFRGGQDSWRRVEMSERYIEATQRHARLQREAFNSLDKAWNARTISNDQIAALQRDVASGLKVIAAYQKEYELGQRSLIDLLNAHNQYYAALVGLESVQGLAVFADYQLLAATGGLLASMNTPHPQEAAPLNEAGGFVAPKIPPVLINPPAPSGPEPLNLGAPQGR